MTVKYLHKILVVTDFTLILKNKFKKSKFYSTDLIRVMSISGRSMIVDCPNKRFTNPQHIFYKLFK